MFRTSSTKFKAHLGRYFSAVRQGKTVVITDRDVDFAKLSPVRSSGDKRESMFYRQRDNEAPPLGDIEIAPVKVKGLTSSDVLREDRNRR